MESNKEKKILSVLAMVFLAAAIIVLAVSQFSLRNDFDSQKQTRGILEANLTRALIENYPSLHNCQTTGTPYVISCKWINPQNDSQSFVYLITCAKPFAEDYMYCTSNPSEKVLNFSAV